MTNDSKATWEIIGKGANATKVADALKATGLDFTVEKRSLFFGPNMKKVERKFATVAKETETFMGIVGDGYEICQNETAFSFADYIDHDLKFVRGGITYSGLCWLVAELPSVRILDEEFVPCLCLQNSFNGKYSLRANIVPIHKATGAQMNPATDVTNALALKHLSYLPAAMKAGQEALKGVSDYMKSLDKMARRYNDIRMNKAQVEMLTDLLFPLRKNMSEAVRAKISEQRRKFVAVHDSTTGGRPSHETAWGLMMSYANYLTHQETKNTKTKFERRFMDTTLGRNPFGDFLRKLETVAAGQAQG